MTRRKGSATSRLVRTSHRTTSGAVLAALLAIGAAQGNEASPSLEARARECERYLAPLTAAVRRLSSSNHVVRGTLSARARDEDGELAEIRGGLAAYHKGEESFRVEIDLKDEDGTRHRASYGVKGDQAWSYDPELGARYFPGPYPEEFALERDLFGVPFFKSLEVDKRRLGSEELAAEGACPVLGVTTSGLAVDGELLAVDGKLLNPRSALHLRGQFPTLFGRLAGEIHMSAFRDVCGGAATAAYRTVVTTSEIVQIEQRFELDQGKGKEAVKCDLDDSELPNFSPPE